MELRGPAADRGVPDVLVRAEHVGVDVPGHLRAAARRTDVGRLCLDAAHLLRRARRPPRAPDAPLGGDDLRRRDDDPPDAGGVHRGLPSAARAELGDRQHPAAARDDRRVHRVLPARRPALGHRDPRGRRVHQGHTRGRHLPVVLPVRRGVPGRLDHPAALHRARAADPRSAARADRRAHAAAGLPQAHAVAGSGSDRAERRGLPDAAGLPGQGGRLLLHGLRHRRADGRAAVDQPGVEVRALRPDEGDGRLPARLVHGLARRCAPDHAQLGDDGVRAHDLLERARPDPGPARRCSSPSSCCCRSSRHGSVGTSGSTTCSSGRATLRRARRSWPR